MKTTYMIIVRDQKHNYIVTTKVVEDQSFLAKKNFIDLKNKYPNDNIKVYVTNEKDKFKQISFEM